VVSNTPHLKGLLNAKYASGCDKLRVGYFGLIMNGSGTIRSTTEAAYYARLHRKCVWTFLATAIVLAIGFSIAERFALEETMKLQNSWVVLLIEVLASKAHLFEVESCLIGLVVFEARRQRYYEQLQLQWIREEEQQQYEKEKYKMQSEENEPIVPETPTSPSITEEPKVLHTDGKAVILTTPS
jgi:hypothetical protein